jgi:hypothetical protein
MSEKDKGDKPPELALRDEGISLADFLKIFNKRKRGQTAKEILEGEGNPGPAEEKPVDEESPQGDLKY